MLKSSRELLPVLFVLALMVLGNLTMSIGARHQHLLLEEIGRAFLLGPIMLLATSLVMHSFFGKEKGYPFRIQHVAWVLSIAIPISSWLGHQPLMPFESLVHGLAFFTSIWVTYWGCRYCVEGTLHRNKYQKSPYFD